jgi:hypothetical protein
LTLRDASAIRPFSRRRDRVVMAGARKGAEALGGAGATQRSMRSESIGRKQISHSPSIAPQRIRAEPLCAKKALLEK